LFWTTGTEPKQLATLAQGASFYTFEQFRSRLCVPPDLLELKKYGALELALLNPVSEELRGVFGRSFFFRRIDFRYGSEADLCGALADVW